MVLDVIRAWIEIGKKGGEIELVDLLEVLDDIRMGGADGVDDETVRTGATIEEVVAFAAHERVVAVVPAKPVVAVAARELVVAVAAIKRVIAGVAIDFVETATTIESVFAGAAMELVIAVA